VSPARSATLPGKARPSSLNISLGATGIIEGASCKVTTTLEAAPGQRTLRER
jgi:hypothetical protein